MDFYLHVAATVVLGALGCAAGIILMKKIFKKSNKRT